jgi:ferredoxin-thioredoxin reductase catalytic subunit
VKHQKENIMQEGKHPHMEPLRARLAEYLKGKKDYSFNTDVETVDSILGAMSMRFEKFGKDYCPCRRVTGDAEKDGQIVCPCAFHEGELAAEGHCHCHLFTKKS